MIIVRVELHSAITGKVTEIARAIINNRGNHPSWGCRGNYNVRAIAGRRRMRDFELARAKPFRSGVVEDYPRKRLHIWNLVARALGSMGYK